MNVDWYLERGRTHDLCEDYATAGVEQDAGYLIVADGCSSSDHVDFGARVMALAAREIILPQLRGRSFLSPEQTADAIAAKAAGVLAALPSLPVDSLDATLLLAMVVPNQAGACATICAWGDGAILVRRAGQVQATLLSFPRNAPCYLSYQVSPDRRKNYFRLQEPSKRVESVVLGPDGAVTDRREEALPIESPLVPFLIELDLLPGDAIAIVSDGITQFCAGDSTTIPWTSLVPQFIHYKQTAGVFLKRRMNFFQRECREAGSIHNDDLGMAALVL